MTALLQQPSATPSRGRPADRGREPRPAAAARPGPDGRRGGPRDGHVLDGAVPALRQRHVVLAGDGGGRGRGHGRDGGPRPAGPVAPGRAGPGRDAARRRGPPGRPRRVVPRRVPGPDAFARMGEALAAALEEVAVVSAPAPTTPLLVALSVAGVGAIALVVDAVGGDRALGGRRRAAAPRPVRGARCRRPRRRPVAAVRDRRRRLPLPAPRRRAAADRAMGPGRRNPWPVRLDRARAAQRDGPPDRADRPGRRRHRPTRAALPRRERARERLGRGLRRLGGPHRRHGEPVGVPAARPRPRR